MTRKDYPYEARRTAMWLYWLPQAIVGALGLVVMLVGGASANIVTALGTGMVAAVVAVCVLDAVL